MNVNEFSDITFTFGGCFVVGLALGFMSWFFGILGSMIYTFTKKFMI